MKTISTQMIPVLPLIVFALLFSELSLANSFTGTILITRGDVKVLTKAISNDNMATKFVLYEGQKFSYKKAKIGLRLKPGQIVHTGSNGKAKVAYTNGDHIVVAPGSSIAMPAPIKGKKGASRVRLFYGKMRALISKKGPRNKLNVKTKSAVAGVRGTDFHISYNGKSGTEVTVLRGKVAIGDERDKKLPTEASDKDVAIVKKGFKAQVKMEPEQKAAMAKTNPSKKKNLDDVANQTDTAMKTPPVLQKGQLLGRKKISIIEASKEKLLEVQASTGLTVAKEDLSQLSKKEAKKIKALDKKTTTAILEDVKEEDPELYKELKQKKDISSEEINTKVVANLYKTAPREKKKPGKIDLDNIKDVGDDVYDKYFK